MTILVGIVHYRKGIEMSLGKPTKQQEENFKRCLENICDNLHHPAVQFSKPCQDHMYSSIQTLFVDIHTGTMASFDSIEISSCKDYRQIHNLIKARIICAIRDVRDLAEESLIKLGDRHAVNE